MPDPFTGEVYTGTEDVMFEGEENRGALPHIGLSSNGNFDYTSLIRFDVTSLENQFLSIQSVTLRMEQTVLLGNGQLGINPLHPTNADWIEGTGGTGPGEPTTSFRKFSTEPWSDASGAPVNSIFNHAVAAIPSNTNDYLVYEQFLSAGTNDFVFRDPSIVETWTQGGSANPGLYIHRAGDPTATFFASSEHENIHWRPQLIVEFEPLVDLPVITNVSSTAADGEYQEGETVPITVTFDTPVLVSTTGGIPTLPLETGGHDGVARYVSGNGSNTLTFDYVVGRGQNTQDLDHQSTALLLNGATIRSTAGTDALLTLPMPGTNGSLSTNKDIVISTPTLLSQVVFQNGLPNPVNGEIYSGTEEVDFQTLQSFFPSSGDINNGGATTFGVSQDEVVDPRLFLQLDRLALIRFDVTSLAGQLDDVRVSRATLRLNPETVVSTDELRAFRLRDANADWIQGDNVSLGFLTPPLADTNEPTARNRHHPGAPWQNGSGDNVATIFDEDVFVGNRDKPVASTGWNPLTPTNVFLLPIPGQFDLDFTDTSFLTEWVSGNNSGLLLNAFGTDTLSDFNSITFSSSESSEIFKRPQLILEFEPAADLTISKSNNAPNGQGEVGETFQWTLHIANNGIVDATFNPQDLILRDSLPDGAIYGTPSITNVNGLTATVDGSPVDDLSSLVSISLFSSLLMSAGSSTVTLAPGGSFDIVLDVTPTVAGTLTSPDSGGICQVDPNRVVHESDEQNNTCSDAILVTGTPDLTVSKFNDTGDNQVEVGDTFQWTLEVKNEGTDDAIFTRGTLILQDQLSPQAQYGEPRVQNLSGITGDLDVSLSEGALEVSPLQTSLTIAPGGSFQIVFDVTPTAVGELTNPRPNGITRVDPQDEILEINESNNDASDSVLVRPPFFPDLIISKTNNITEGYIDVGSTFQWTIRVENQGQDNATFAGVPIFIDILPEGATYGEPAIVEETLTGVTGPLFCSYSSLTSSVQCTTLSGAPLTIAPGGSFEVVFDVTPDTTGTLTNLPFAVDPLNTVEELIEINNIASADTVLAIDETLVVDTTVDESNGNFRAGDLSLREAIELANLRAGPNTITFDSDLFSQSQVIVLNSPLVIDDSLTLDGPGIDNLTLDRNGLRGSVLSITGGHHLIQNLSVTGGDNGIVATDTDSLTLFNVRANNSANRGISVSGGQGDVLLVSTEASNNGANGIFVSEVDSLRIDGSSSFLTNQGVGIHAGTVREVTLTGVVAIGNGTGARLENVESLTDRDGHYSENDDHGIQLIDIGGDVTLIGTTLENNDNDNDVHAVGDGLNATDGDDEDNSAIGGNLLVEGATIRVVTLQTQLQQRGVFVESVSGNVTFRSSQNQQAMQVTGHESTGVLIAQINGTATFIGGDYSHNGLDGLSLGAHPLEEVAVSAVAISGGLFFDNNNNGINLGTITGSVNLTDVTADANRQEGLMVSSAQSVSIEGGSFSDSILSSGVYLDTIHGLRELIAPEAREGNAEGGFIPQTDAVEIRNGSYLGNGDNGIRLNQVAGSVSIELGLYANNQSHGLSVGESAGDPISSVTINGGLYTNNGTEAAPAHGIHIENIEGSVSVTGVEASGNNSGLSVSSTAFVNVDDSVFTDNLTGIQLDHIDEIELTDINANDNRGTGLSASMVDSVTIQDGFYRDNTLNGIELTTVGSIVLDTVRANNNGSYGLSVDGAGSARIDESFFSRNGLDGIKLMSMGEETESADGENVLTAELKKVTTVANSGNGISIENITGNVSLSEMSTTSNSSAGIDLRSINGDVSLTDVTAEENLVHGLFVLSAGSITVSNSSFTQDSRLADAESGIKLEDVEHVTLSRVTADRGHEHGLDVALASSVTIEGESSFSENENGISLQDVFLTVSLTGVDVFTNNNSGLSVLRADSVNINGGSYSINGSFEDENFGNGIILDAIGSVVLTNVNGSNNAALGLHVIEAGSITVNNSTFSNTRELSQDLVLAGLESDTRGGLHLETVGEVHLTDVSSDGHDEFGLKVDSANAVTLTNGSYSFNGTSPFVGTGVELGEITSDVRFDNVLATENRALGAIVSKARSFHAINGSYSSNGADGIRLLDLVTTVTVEGSAFLSNDKNFDDNPFLGGGVFTDSEIPGGSGLVISDGTIGSISVTGGLFAGNSNADGPGTQHVFLLGNRINGNLTINDNNPFPFDIRATEITGDVTLGDGEFLVTRPLTVGSAEGGGMVDVVDGGTLRAQDTLTATLVTIHEGAVLEGLGNIEGDVLISGGTVAPGNSPGHLTINGNIRLDSNSILEIEIGGPIPGIDYDVLEVTGNATIEGTIVIIFINGYIPTAGQQFDYLNVGGALNMSTAAFELTNLPTGLQFQSLFPLTTPTALPIQTVPTSTQFAFGNADPGIFIRLLSPFGKESPEGLTPFQSPRQQSSADSPASLNLSSRSGNAIRTDALPGGTVQEDAILAEVGVVEPGRIVVLEVEQNGVFVEIERTTADENGAYRFRSRPSGNYRIRAMPTTNDHLREKKDPKGKGPQKTAPQQPSKQDPIHPEPAPADRNGREDPQSTSDIIPLLDQIFAEEGHNPTDNNTALMGLALATTLGWQAPRKKERENCCERKARTLQCPLEIERSPEPYPS